MAADGRRVLRARFVAVTAVALYFLWSREGLPGWLRFGGLLVATMAADKLFKFEAYMALLTPVILIGGMATGLFTPTEAAVAAVAWALFLGFIWYRTLNWRMLIKISMETIETTAIVLFIVASASIFAWVLTTTQITEAIAQWVLSISDNPLVFLLLANSSCCSSAASWRPSRPSPSSSPCSCRSSPSSASIRSISGW